MAFADFLTKTATVKRLGATSKTVRTLTSVGTIEVSEPQVKNEMDLVAGVNVTRHYIYTNLTSDVKRQDELTIDSNEYVVLEILENEFKNIVYKTLITAKST